MYEGSISFVAGLSTHQLLDITGPQNTFDRHAIVIWLYLMHRPETGFEEFDAQLKATALKELSKRRESR